MTTEIKMIDWGRNPATVMIVGNALAFLLLMALSFGGLQVEAATLTHLRVDLRVQQYNSFAETYISEPAVVYVRGKKRAKKNKQTLIVEYEAYGVEEPTMLFYAYQVGPHIEHIEKFLSWEEMAMESGDVLDKVIGKEKAYPGYSNEYRFFSGNSSNHFLHIQVYVFGRKAEESVFYFDRKNALIFLQLLKDFQAGEFPKKDNTSEKYK